MDAVCVSNIDFYQKCLSLTRKIFSTPNYAGARVSRNEYGSYGFFISRLFKEIDIINEEKDIYLKGYLGMTGGFNPPFLRVRTWWRIMKRKLKRAFSKGTRRTR